PPLAELMGFARVAVESVEAPIASHGVKHKQPGLACGIEPFACNGAQLCSVRFLRYFVGHRIGQGALDERSPRGQLREPPRLEHHLWDEYSSVPLGRTPPREITCSLHPPRPKPIPCHHPSVTALHPLRPRVILCQDLSGPPGPPRVTPCQHPSGPPGPPRVTPCQH